MKQQFRLVWKDLRKNAGMAIWFAVEIFLTLLYLTMLTGSLCSLQNYLHFLERTPVTSFHCRQSSGRPLSVSPSLDKELSHLLGAHSSVYSVASGLHPENDDSTNVIVALGCFQNTFGLHPENSAGGSGHTQVLLGNKIQKYHENDTISLGTFALQPLRVTGKLPRGSFYSDVSASTLRSLDDSIVILTTWDEWKSYNTTDYTMQLLQNMVFTGSSQKNAPAFAQMVSHETERLDLLAVSPAETQAAYHNYAQQQLLFLLFFAGIAILLIIGLVTSLLSLIESNLREYAVHRVYGATFMDICLRTVLYCCMIVLIPSLAVLLVLRSFSFPFLFPWIVPVFSLLILFAVCAYPVHRLHHQDISEFLRSDT